MLSQETQKLINQIVERWDEVRASFVLSKEEYGTECETRIGHIWWDNPNLIWILVTNKKEGYEGSQSQVGLAKDGTLRWEYQSHCSCNDYTNTNDLPEQFTESTLKSFDFTYTEPPLSWEKEMRENMEKILTWS